MLRSGVVIGVYSDNVEASRPLTVNTVDEVVFSVLIIPHTLNVTTLGGWRADAEVNLEVDLMARYLARLIEESAAPGARS